MNKLNKKGFTLVELLATIVILGVIAAIAMVSIDKILENSQITECENILLSIKSATKDYVSTNRFDKSKDELGEVTVAALINGGFLSSSINNPFDKTPVNSSNLMVHVTLNDDYTYEDAQIKNGANIVTCENISGVKTVEVDGTTYTYVRFPG